MIVNDAVVVTVLCRWVPLLKKIWAAIMELWSTMRWRTGVPTIVSSTFIHVYNVNAFFNYSNEFHCCWLAALRTSQSSIFHSDKAKIMSVISQCVNKQCQRVKDLLPWPLWLLWHLINIKLTDQSASAQACKKYNKIFKKIILKRVTV